MTRQPKDRERTARIVSMYRDLRMTPEEIGREVGLVPGYVRQILTGAGVPVLRKERVVLLDPEAAEDLSSFWD